MRAVKLADLKSAFLWKNIAAFVKWILCSVFIGLFVGAAGTFFHFGLKTVSDSFGHNRWLLYFLPLGGVAIAALYKIADMGADKGTDSIFASVRSAEKIKLRTAPLIFLGTIITHMFGGSAGREGAALQLGGSIAYGFGSLFQMDEKDKRIITMCGMSAGFAALFGTPIAAAVFSLEVISVGVMYYAGLVPCIVSAVVAARFSAVCGVAPTAFKLAAVPEADILTFLRVLLLSALVAALGMLCCRIFEWSKKLAAKYIKNIYLRAATGGVIIIALTLIVGTYDYNGAGMNVITRALIAGEARPEAFILKIIFTAVTLSCGFRGGEIVPVFFTGATFGNTASRLIGLNPAFGGGLGMVSLFCAVTNCPLTSIVLAAEIFGMNGFMYFAVAIAVSYMLSGYSGLYSEQKIMYSKLRPEFIDRKVE